MFYVCFEVGFSFQTKYIQSSKSLKVLPAVPFLLHPKPVLCLQCLELFSALSLISAVSVLMW